MQAFAEYSAYDGVGLAEAVRRREVHPLELTAAALERIESVNPQLNAVIYRMDERGRELAGAAAEKYREAPLAGVPFLLKDLTAMLAGTPTTGSCRLLKDFVPDQNSLLVSRYLEAGLTVVGKTSTPELGLLPTTESDLRGATHNPWRRGTTPGGSSGGSAAMVAAGVVPLAHANDGGGSIRIPASCCGLFGLKPTRGMTPLGPFQSEVWRGLAIDHVVSRTVRDSAAAFDATAGPEPGGWYHVTPPARLSELTPVDGGLRIGWTRAPFLPSKIHPDCVSAVEDAAKLCQDLGHRVEEVHVDTDPPRFAFDYLALTSVAMATEVRVMGDMVGKRPTYRDFEPTTWLTAMLGRHTLATDYELAVRRLQALTRKVGDLFERYDVLLTPTLAEPPPRHGELFPTGVNRVVREAVVRADLGSILRIRALREQLANQVFQFIPFTPLANVTGQPSMSVPLWWNAQDIPIGAMFTAAAGGEPTLIGLALALEEARPWRHRRPPVHAF